MSLFENRLNGWDSGGDKPRPARSSKQAQRVTCLMITINRQRGSLI